MSKPTASEKLFEDFCSNNMIPCTRIATSSVRTPDFAIQVRGIQLICEVKQIDPNHEDLRELAALRKGSGSSRYLPNRLRGKLKHVSDQLRCASATGGPTMLVIYDNTPFKAYTSHADVVQAMFGRSSVTVSIQTDPSLPPKVSAPFFGGNRGLDPHTNTAISAIAILDGGPLPPCALRVYHNPYAAVRLDPEAFEGLPVVQPILPETRSLTE